MSHQMLNPYQQPIGQPVNKQMAKTIPAERLQGQHCYLVPVDPHAHGPALYQQLGAAPDDRDWTYMVDGPFATLEAYCEFLERMAATAGQQYYTIIEADTSMPVGNAALMRHDAANGVIEVGNIMYSRRLQRTVAGTEAIFLLMDCVFEAMNYRRLEWKCDHLNAPSRRAAQRYGFVFEGVFRQAVIYKGRNRDTAWYSIIDAEWPAIRQGFQQWLSAENFAAGGKQRSSLEACIAAQQPSD